MRGLARSVYRYGTWAMFVLIVVQFVAAGAGLFSALAQDSTAGSILQYHRVVGPVLMLAISILGVIAAIVGRLPWRMMWLAAAFFPLLVLQSVLIVPFEYPDAIPALGRMPWLASLHVVNALLILWLALQWPVWARDAIDPLVKNEISPAKPVRAQG